MTQTFKSHSLLIVFIVLLAIYAVISVSTPADPAMLSQYGISESRFRLITLSLTALVISIWSLAFYGFSKIKRYADSIGDHKDGTGFSLIAQGLMWLAISMAFRSALTSSFERIVTEYPRLESFASIVENYTYVLFALVTFILISNGARELAGIVKLRNTVERQHLWIVITSVIASLFTYLVMVRPTGSNTYGLPDLAIILTIIIPLVYAWYRGFLAAYHLLIYRRRVRGAIYKKGLAILVAGLVLTVISSILIQFILAINATLTSLDITPLLTIVYALVLVIGSSFALIVIGANKLQKIESAGT